MRYPDPQAIRHWREVADELISEPNTGRMVSLLRELNQAAGELEEVKIVLEWQRSARGTPS
jgi:hypothetical protein